MKVKLPGARGFSLLETLVCLLLLSVLLWGVLPRYFHYQREKNLSRAVTMVGRTIALARQNAIHSRTMIRVLIDPEENQLGVVSWKTGEPIGKINRLPPGIVFGEISETIQPLVFRPDGALAGVSGSIILRNEVNGKTRTLVVYALTGQIRSDAR